MIPSPTNVCDVSLVAYCIEQLTRLDLHCATRLDLHCATRLDLHCATRLNLHCATRLGPFSLCHSSRSALCHSSQSALCHSSRSVFTFSSIVSTVSFALDPKVATCVLCVFEGRGSKHIVVVVFTPSQPGRLHQGES